MKSRRLPLGGGSSVSGATTTTSGSVTNSRQRVHKQRSTATSEVQAEKRADPSQLKGDRNSQNDSDTEDAESQVALQPNSSSAQKNTKVKKSEPPSSAANSPTESLPGDAPLAKVASNGAVGGSKGKRKTPVKTASVKGSKDSASKKKGGSATDSQTNAKDLKAVQDSMKKNEESLADTSKSRKSDLKSGATAAGKVSSNTENSTSATSVKPSADRNKRAPSPTARGSVANSSSSQNADSLVSDSPISTPVLPKRSQRKRSASTASATGVGGAAAAVGGNHRGNTVSEVSSVKAATSSAMTVKVKILVDGKKFSSNLGKNLEAIRMIDATGGGAVGLIGLGVDGNQYYCQVCGEYGNVVCCDGCPRVYHRECIPLETPSRKSLENDDEPWFCPNCFPNKGKTSSAATAKQQAASSKVSRRSDKIDRRSTSQHRCVDCHEIVARLSLEPCEECGNYVHFPSCTVDDDDDDEEEVKSRSSSGKKGRVFCSTCKAVNDLTNEEDELFKKKDARRDIGDEGDGDGSSETEERATSQNGSKHQLEEDDVDEYMENPPTNALSASKDTKKKRGRPKKRGIEEVDPSTEKSGDKKKKKRKKGKKDKSIDNADANSQNDEYSVSQMDDADETATHDLAEPDTTEDHSAPAASSPSKDLPLTPAQAVPAFYFYLAENRWKIERVLARTNRYFNRLPKGDERNALVAKEAALWWVKLRPTDHRRYMNMSMRDYESRIIEWKEEKSIRDMMTAGTGDDDDQPMKEDVRPTESDGDEKLTLERHQRLYLSTSVGSKPFKPEPDQSYNRVLLDLLHDMRFHPLPIFSVNRPDSDTVIDEHNAKVTIPHFDVHGPISTSLGDECVGCSRGWTHFCPVLQRRIPAQEHRAKLQPPLSSLMATRVGLGLRPRMEKLEQTSPHQKEPSGMFEWKDSTETIELRNLPILPSSTLSDPSERADDIVKFIEETTAMKVPEPRRPPGAENFHEGIPGSNKQGESGEVSSSASAINKCGRCRAIVKNDTGCVQCRRAQLVINMSKRQPSQKNEGKLLKVHTAMLGRVQMREGSGESQSPGDQAVSNAILKENWTPCSILPPQKSLVPTPSRRQNAEPHEQSDESTASETSEDLDSSSTSDSSQDSTRSPPPEDTDIRVDDEGDERRPRSARLLAGAATTIQMDASEPSDRQKLLEEHQREASALHKKTLSIACCGILLALMRRDPLLLFAEPVAAENYCAIVKNPTDFGKIRSNVLAKKYQTLGSFVSDARLLCENALAYNPPGTIYWKTAKELQEVLAVMQRRAQNWMGAIKDAHTSFLSREESKRRKSGTKIDEDSASAATAADPFEELRTKWPEAVAMLENSDWLRNQIEADFMRTKENETAYYGSLAVRRVSIAAEASLAPYTDSCDMHSVVSKRNYLQDEALRKFVDDRVSSVVDPVELKDISTWREEAVVRLMRKVQSRRLERRIVSENGCAKCDGVVVDTDMKLAMNADSNHIGRMRKKGEADIPRVDASRMELTTGLASRNTRTKIRQRQKQTLEESYDTLNDVCVSVRGSKIHGWGLFADQPFRKGDVVAEYIGEYIGNAVADAREKVYQEQRIQDYQFRLDDKLVLDATMKGGNGRYINHNCTPNCFAKIIPGKEPDTHLKRVMIIAQRDIEINEEISYDYQFPLELDLDARIPCNCQSDACRGFMNWDLPEKGSNNRALLVQKRGANMRDRIRRLNRPLKRDELAD